MNVYIISLRFSALDKHFEIHVSESRYLDHYGATMTNNKENNFLRLSAEVSCFPAAGLASLEALRLEPESGSVDSASPNHRNRTFQYIE